jgi:hypothetical protein
MLGIDLDKILRPIEENMKIFVSKLDRVIELLEEVSKKLDDTTS